MSNRLVKVPKTLLEFQKMFSSEEACNKAGISALCLQRLCGIGQYRTPWLLMHKLRASLGERGALLSGLVEVDETFLGRGNLASRGVKKHNIVAAAVEVRKSGALGRAKIQVTGDRTALSLQSFVLRAVDEGSSVMTDGYSSYDGLAWGGYFHFISQSNESDDPLPGAHTMFGNLKTWLRGTFHGVSEKHLPAYLQEFVYRFNRRSDEADIFRRMLRRATLARAVTYRQLVAEQSA